jgi:hypothetical protein
MGLFDMFSKSPLVDCNKYLSNISGKIAGAPYVDADGQFSVFFIPDDKNYLLNRNQTANSDGRLELKVNLEASGRHAFLDAVKAMAGKTVCASGVLVNDDSRNVRAEVNPLDLLVVPLNPEQFPDWFKIIQKNLKDQNAVSVYRIAAASDASKSKRPPKADVTRTAHAFFNYPPKPNVTGVKIDFEIRKTVSVKADVQLSHEIMKERIEMHATVSSAKDDGPGVFAGDLVIYWGNV